MKKLLIICGPTGTGKTKLALALAKKFNGELINADSRQVYKGLDALTGKDRSEDIPIWLYDIVDSDAEFNVAHFVSLARRAITNIKKRKKLPIVVGGTGFYLRALTRPIETITIPPNVPLRKKLRSLSLSMLQQKVQQVDRVRWKAMNESDRKNSRRLIRAIEVAQSGAASLQSEPYYEALWIGLHAPLTILKQRIDTRVVRRWDTAVGEMRDDLPPLLGSEPLRFFLRGEISKDEAVAAWANAEYQYAKRQMTWFRKEQEIRWFDVQNPRYLGQVEAMVEEWYTR